MIMETHTNISKGIRAKGWFCLICLLVCNFIFSKIGNIKVDNIDDIVLREMKRGQSWFRIRNQEPCNKCVLQWLCPSPSDYELAIGRPNLCGVMD